VRVHIGAGLGGVLKSKPEDFIVEEVHDDGICTTNYTLAQRVGDLLPRRRKNYIHFTLVKRDLTTQRAISILARALRVSRRRLSYAGIKDRISVSAQRISIQDGDIGSLKGADIGKMVVKQFMYRNKRVYPGGLVGNRFTVTVGEIPKQKDEMVWILERFADRARLGVRNYFGEQRFGSRQNNHVIGKHILKDEWREAVEEFLCGSPLEGERWRNDLKENWGDWQGALRTFPKSLRFERSIIQGLKNGKSFRGVIRRLPIYRLFVHAYQSHIFNLVLERMEKLPDEVPLVGKDTPSDGLVGEILESEGMRPDYFGFRGTMRRSLFIPEGFEVLRAEDGLCKIMFTLPKGSYATVLLRELNSTRSHN
jgi:tRNA pseudouridine13 synthase